MYSKLSSTLRKEKLLSIAGILVFTVILLGGYMIASRSQEAADANPPGPPAPLALSIVLRDTFVPVGGEFEGEVVLNQVPKAAVEVRISSSAPYFVAVSPAMLVVAGGHRSSTFVYRGAAAGHSTLNASVPGYKAASIQVMAVSEPIAGTLREAADRRKLLIGAAGVADEFGFPSPLTTEPAYASTLGKQYNMLEAENAMKWIAIHPAKDTYNFEPADQLVDFAIANHMKVRGHNLCWGSTNPKWLDAYKTAPPSEVAEILHRHIQMVMAHYRGKVFAWDVVNEAIDDKTSGKEVRLQNSIWYNQPGIGMTGTGFIEQAFRWAHEADPGALLFYNENNIEEPGDKFDAMYGMLADLLSRGVPINGVGIQAHIGRNGFPHPERLAANIRRLTSLGLQVHLTEVDVPIPVDVEGKGSPSDLDRQARTYENLLEVCLRDPGCTAFQTWGFTDKHSWVPAYMPGLGAALPFDSSYQPKAAFHSMMKALTGSAAR